MRRSRLFSKRHQRAILDQSLSFSVPKRLRRRIWSILDRFNFQYTKTDDSGWNSDTDVLSELEPELLYRYGVERLEAYRSDETRGPVDLKGFIAGGYPSQVFDVAELFYSETPDDQKLSFQAEINSAMEDENCSWRLADGQFFRVDSAFVELNLIASSYELMKAQGYEGALDEFNEARNDLLASDFKGAILNACKSFESVLKAVSSTSSGNASALIRGLPRAGFFDGMPQGFEQAFGDTVLMVLPFLRNRLGGHGQGDVVQDVPKLYAELAINLSAALNLFIIRRSLELKPEIEPVVPEVPPDPEDEIPF
jgi:hypothetical protein